MLDKHLVLSDEDLYAEYKEKYEVDQVWHDLEVAEAKITKNKENRLAAIREKSKRFRQMQREQKEEKLRLEALKSAGLLQEVIFRISFLEIKN